MMPYQVVIKDEALFDMREAYAYYELQKIGLGEAFLSALEKRFSDLALYPELYSYIDNQRILRDIALDRFPYVVIYEINLREVIVYAVHLTFKDTSNRYRLE